MERISIVSYLEYCLKSEAFITTMGTVLLCQYNYYHQELRRAQWHKGEIICIKRSEKATASAGLGKEAVEKEMAYIKLDGTHIITTEGVCRKL